MKTVATSVKKFLRPNSRCPQAIQWLAVLMQLWAAGIFLYTFSNGMFLARLAYTNRLDRTNTYAKYPQFWYVLVGCTVLPIIASRLKHLSRTAWFLGISLMAITSSGAMMILVADTEETFKLGTFVPSLHVLVGITVSLILFSQRNHFFKTWEPDPEWLTKPRFTCRSLLTSGYKNLKLLSQAPWKMILWKTFNFVVFASVFSTLAFVLIDRYERKIEKLAGMIESTCESLLPNSWGMRWRLRWVPFSCYDQMFYTMGDADRELCIEMDSTAEELCRLGGEMFLHDFRINALSHALYCNRRDMVEYYLSKTPSDAPFSAYLYMSSAVNSGNVILVERLMKAGYSVKVKHPRTQQTVLGSSIYKNHLAMAKWLIDHGVNPQDKTLNNETVLFLAAFNGRQEMADLFLLHGCNPLDRNIDGKTLFHAFTEGFYHSEDRKLAMITWLVKQGVDPEIKDKFGKTAGDNLSGHQLEEWKSLLAQATGKAPPNSGPDDWFGGMLSEETASNE